jgi:hypothetical protein
VINEAEVSGSFDALGIVHLSKQLPSTQDKIGVELCEKVSKQRSIAKWMDFNFFYIFDMNRIKKKAKSLDEMLPYEYFIDLTYNNLGNSTQLPTWIAINS